MDEKEIVIDWREVRKVGNEEGKIKRVNIGFHRRV